MISTEQVRDLIGRPLVDSADNKVGKIGQIFLDDRTGRPEWATVNTGLFGSSESFVPLADADAGDDTVRVPFTKDRIKDAPDVDVDRGHLDESEEAELYRHYGLDYSGDDTGTESDGDASAYPVDGSDSSATDSSPSSTMASSDSTVDDRAMTRSEERLRAGTETVRGGTARLRKWVETEEQQITVPVRKEKARLEAEPVTDAHGDAAASGAEISEDEHEVTLSEERPVVTKETVPVERVRITKDVETSEETVTEDVRKERISADGDVDIRDSATARE